MSSHYNLCLGWEYLLIWFIVYIKENIESNNETIQPFMLVFMNFLAMRLASLIYYKMIILIHHGRIKLAWCNLRVHASHTFCHVTLQHLPFQHIFLILSIAKTFMTSNTQTYTRLSLQLFFIFYEEDNVVNIWHR